MCGARSRRLPIRDACMSGGAAGGAGRAAAAGRSPYAETGDNVKSNVLYVMSFRKTRLRKRRAARFRDRTTTDDDLYCPAPGRRANPQMRFAKCTNTGSCRMSGRTSNPTRGCAGGAIAASVTSIPRLILQTTS